LFDLVAKYCPRDKIRCIEIGATRDEIYGKDTAFRAVFETYPFSVFDIHVYGTGKYDEINCDMYLASAT